MRVRTDWVTVNSTVRPRTGARAVVEPPRTRGRKAAREPLRVGRFSARGGRRVRDGEYREHEERERRDASEAEHPGERVAEGGCERRGGKRKGVDEGASASGPREPLAASR